MHRFYRVTRLPQRLAGASTEVVQFELIGRDDVGRRHGLVPHKFGDTLAHKNSTTDISNHRIATIFCTRIGLSDGCERFKNSQADFSGPHIAGERSEEHTSELQSLRHLVCRLLLE